MLHATCSPGKSSMYKRYLGYRDGIEKKVHEEDEITSTVIGPLDFLPPRDVFRFWCGVLASSGKCKFLPKGYPDSADVKLWHSRIVPLGGRRVEPDVRIDFRWTDGSKFTLLIEIKWRARLSGGDQLHAQWSEYLTEMERQSALHVFLAVDVSAASVAKEEADVWNDRLVLVTWLQIRNVFAEILRLDHGGFGRWAKVADGFLEKIGVRRFSGFYFLNEFIIPMPHDSGALFWRPWSGWSEISPDLEGVSDFDSDSIFFKLSN